MGWLGDEFLIFVSFAPIFRVEQDVSKYTSQHWSDAPENLSSLKRTSIEHDLLDRVTCVEALVAV